MKRKLLTIATGMSLSIAVFAIIIWIGGLGETSWICSRDIDGWPTSQIWAFGEGGRVIAAIQWLHFEDEHTLDMARRNFRYAHADGLGSRVYLSVNQYTTTLTPWGRAGFFYKARALEDMGYQSQGIPTRFTIVAFPLWSVVLCVMPIPALWLRACWRDRRQLTRRAKGLCAACGYDLRESAGRCPECGRSKDSA